MRAGTPAPSSNPGQGFSVALNDRGNTMLLGAPSDNANTGAAWAFTLSSGTWTPEAKKLVGTGAVGAAGQGASVALSRNGSTAIIGGPLDQDATGAAWAFVQLFTLTVSDNGAGTISSSRSNIDCQTECSSSYLGGTQVTLTATPQSGYVFAGWSGACSGTGSCVVTMSMAENVTATYYPAQDNKQIISGNFYEDRATYGSSSNVLVLTFTQTPTNQFLNITNVSCAASVASAQAITGMTLFAGTTSGANDLGRPYSILGSATPESSGPFCYYSIVTNQIYYKFGPGRYPAIEIDTASSGSASILANCVIVGNLTDN
jgi:hypothetical protein